MTGFHCTCILRLQNANKEVVDANVKRMDSEKRLEEAQTMVRSAHVLSGVGAGWGWAVQCLVGRLGGAGRFGVGFSRFI